MRENLGMACHVAGLILMPIALYQGFQENGSLGDELLLGGAGFVLILLGRALRGGGGTK